MVTNSDHITSALTSTIGQLSELNVPHATHKEKQW
jgi:hypothetical protein